MRNSPDTVMLWLTTTSVAGLLLELAATPYALHWMYGAILLQIGFVGLCCSWIAGVVSVYYYRKPACRG